MGAAGAGDAGTPHAGADGDGDGDGEGGRVLWHSRRVVVMVKVDGELWHSRLVYVLVWEVMLHHGEPDRVMK